MPEKIVTIFGTARTNPGDDIYELRKDLTIVEIEMVLTELKKLDIMK